MTITLAVDCMGGDHGPSVTLPAVVDFLRHDTDCAAILVGREELLRPAVGASGGRVRQPPVDPSCFSEVVGMDEAVASALRGKKDSSMRVAVDLVKEGGSRCRGVGRQYRRLDGDVALRAEDPARHRPAGHLLHPALGTRQHLCARSGCQRRLQPRAPAAVRHHGFLAGIGTRAQGRPTVALLNIGEEDIKGNEVVKRAAELLRATDLNFVGNVEGNDIFKGTADVVVCDGFVGNVTLKASEGLAHMIGGALKEEFSRNIFTKLAALVAMPCSNPSSQRFDPRRYNGASLLGLKGIVVKSHGSADQFAFRLCAGKGGRRGAAAPAGSDRGAHGRRPASADSLRLMETGDDPYANQRHRQLSARRAGQQRGLDRRARARIVGRVDRRAHRHPQPPSGRGRRHQQRSGTGSQPASTCRQPVACAEDVDLIIVATSTPDYVFPSAAALLQSKLGITNGAPAFDVQAVCSGFVYALTIADKFIRSGSHKCALVVGAEVFSRILDWKDRGTCVLFGDGAGAVVLEACRPARVAGQRLARRRQSSRHSCRAGPGLRRRRNRRSLPAHGRAGRVQVRGQGAGRCRQRSAGGRRDDGGAGRLADSASGQCAHPAGDRQETPHAGRKSASSPWPITAIPRRRRFRWRWTKRSAPGAYSAASTCCWRVSAAASPGARPCSGSEFERLKMKFALV